MSNTAADDAQRSDDAFYSNEYLDWLLQEWDRDEELEPFQGVRYCTLARKCPCKTCQDQLEINWPYNKALSANLLHLSGFPLSEITEAEVQRFEKSMINDFIDKIDEFNEYVTDICSSGSHYGLHVLKLFVDGSFDKPMTDHSTESRRDHMVTTIFRLLIVNDCYQRKSEILRELCSFRTD